MSIEISNESGFPIDEVKLLAVARHSLDEMGVNPMAELSILLVDSEYMGELNHRWMGKTGPTDVLAFPMDELEIDRGPGVDRFRSLLTRHGWNGAGFDIDHVQDIGWGGPDEPVNLWPLNSAFNQNAGNRFQQLRLTYSNVPGGGPATPTTTNVRLGDAAQAAGRDNIIGRWFIITSIGP
ncbi:MAG: putative rRNA maturation factor [Cryptosporangiaceae bacterium]|nr:putative rRNA maturation factor [Cryptosporangiaceae bacterium]